MAYKIIAVWFICTIAVVVIWDRYHRYVRAQRLAEADETEIAEMVANIDRLPLHCAQCGQPMSLDMPHVCQPGDSA